MKRVVVKSSAIRSVGYDEPTLTLELEFTTGDVYQYFKVPAAFHRLLMLADSKGQFVTAYIANGDFDYREMRQANLSR